MENKKYELVEDNTIEIDDRTLYRIRALKDFNNVKKGDLCGYIEKEENLSHKKDCWVYDNARVFDNAEVYGDAKVLVYDETNNVPYYENIDSDKLESLVVDIVKM